MREQQRRVGQWLSAWFGTRSMEVRFLSRRLNPWGATFTVSRTQESTTPQLRIECADGVPLPTLTLKTVLDALATLHDVAPLAEFRASIVPDADDDDDEMTMYNYRFTAQDGREWRQVLRVFAEGGSDQSFNVRSFWRLEEFTAHRAVRQAVIDLIQQYGCTLLIVRWDVESEDP